MYPIENLGILLGIGYDMEYDDDKIVFVDPAEIPIINKENKESIVYTGKGNTIYQLVQNRMSKMPTKFTVGTEQISIISENRAKIGIKDIIDVIFRDTNSNLNCLIAVNKGKCKAYLDMNNKTDETNSMIIYDLLTFSHFANFFQEKVTVAELFKMYYQEGRKICVPYIDINNNKPEITGIALFDKDKMVFKVPINEAIYFNILKNSKGKGYLYLSAKEDLSYFNIEEFNDYSLITTPSEQNYLEIYADSKKDVKVSMIEGRLKYNINISISGVIMCNTLINQYIDKDTIGLLEEVFTKKIKEQLNKEVSKIQHVYQDDYLDLGQYAVAKYGRNSKYASKEYFERSIIEVEVNVTIKSVGRNSRL
jgi:Ger(x)C family germination protein